MNDKDLLQAGYRYALSLRASTSDAEDLVQEAWYRLYRHQGRVAGKAYLFTAIRNIYVDRYRREQLVVIEPLDTVFELVEEASDPIAARLAARDREAPLAGLGAAEREVLLLNVVKGYTAQEIGTFTGRPRGTVLSLIHRAKRKLRGAIEAQAGGDAVSEGGGTSR